MLLSSTHHLVLLCSDYMSSISNRSVVIIDPYRSLYISFQPECLYVLLVHCNLFLCHSTYKVLVMFLVTLSSGVFSTSIISVIFFSQNGLTSQGSWFHSFVKEATLFYLFLFRFSLVPSQISGRDPLVVVECCDAPRPMRQVSSSHSLSLPCLLLACCIFIMSSYALHHHVFKTCIRTGSPTSVCCPF